MAIVTYISAQHGFGVTYEDAWLTHVDDPSDPRLMAAWRAHLPASVAGSVLFVPQTATAADVAAGLVPNQLITTDDQPLEPRTLASWDWDEEARSRGAQFLELTGTASLDASAVYWRGFPVLQFSAVPAPDEDAPDEEAPQTQLQAAPIEVLGMLLTPAQTFTSLLVMPLTAVEEWGERFQTLMDGFYLVPIEREGHVRTAHQFVRSLHVEAQDVREDLTPR